jgi:hypothetical protein
MTEQDLNYLHNLCGLFPRIDFMFFKPRYGFGMLGR